MTDQNILTPPPTVLHLHTEGYDEPQLMPTRSLPVQPTQPKVASQSLPNSQPVSEPTAPSINPPKPKFADFPTFEPLTPVAPKKRPNPFVKMILFAVILVSIVAIGTGAWLMVQDKKAQIAVAEKAKAELQAQIESQEEPNLAENPDFINSLPDFSPVGATPSALPSSTPKATVRPTPTPSPTPTPVVKPTPVPSPSSTSFLSNSQAPENWAKFDFPQASLVIYTPKNWKASLEEFPKIPSRLIRMWQGANSSTATIQIDVKTNWDNTGNAQTQPRTFNVDGQTMAYVQEPTPGQQGDRAQTNYFFEKNGSVYVMSCVHNFIPEQVQLCKDILRTAQFK